MSEVNEYIQSWRDKIIRCAGVTRTSDRIWYHKRNLVPELFGFCHRVPKQRTDKILNITHEIIDIKTPLRNKIKYKILKGNVSFKNFSSHIKK